MNDKRLRTMKTTHTHTYTYEELSACKKENARGRENNVTKPILMHTHLMYIWILDNIQCSCSHFIHTKDNIEYDTHSILSSFCVLMPIVRHSEDNAQRRSLLCFCAYVLFGTVERFQLRYFLEFLLGSAKHLVIGSSSKRFLRPHLCCSLELR